MRSNLVHSYLQQDSEVRTRTQTKKNSKHVSTRQFPALWELACATSQRCDMFDLGRTAQSKINVAYKLSVVTTRSCSFPFIVDAVVDFVAQVGDATSVEQLIGWLHIVVTSDAKRDTNVGAAFVASLIGGASAFIGAEDGGLNAPGG
jgi:hypothetical protein